MLAPGTQVAGYSITGILGRGGMGIVYEATQLSLNRTVALKILAPDLGSDISFRERFRREGQIQAAIDHPNIITVYEAGEVEHSLFIAMRLIRGPTLKDLIISRELEAGRTLRLLAPVANALDSAHAVGLIHRDVKPQNILVGERDHAFLADFGLTKGSEQSDLTRTGQFVGTIDYISPEQIRGEAAVAASDVYAFGAMLYECLTGVVPYPKPSDAAVLFAHMADPAPLITEQRPELPPALDEVIAKAMTKEPERRHKSVTDLVEEAERAFGNRIRAAITPPHPIEIPEQTGIRPPEKKVPTRETRVRVAGEIAEAAASDTLQGAAPSLRPPGETRIPTPDVTREAALPPTPSGERHTKAPAGNLTRAAEIEGLDWTPGETVRSPVAETRAQSAPAGARGSILLALAAIAAAAGFAIGHSSGGGNATSEGFPNSASTADLGLSFPAGWRRESLSRSIADVSVSHPLALSSVANREAGLVAGLTNADGPILLPTTLISALPTRPAAAERVRLGELEAQRYVGLRPRGFDGLLNAYAIPTTMGTATVFCFGPAGATAALQECARVAATLSLQRGRAFPLGPRKDYATGVGAAIGRLNAARARERRALRVAKTRSGQADVARGLASSYRRAASQIGGLQTSPIDRPAGSALSAALVSAAVAYEQLGSAAASGDDAGFQSAATRVRLRDRAVNRALDGLRRLGYRIS